MTSVNICTTQITGSGSGSQKKDVCKNGIPEVSDSSCKKKEVCKIGIPEESDSSCQREVYKSVPGVGVSNNSLLRAANEVRDSSCHQEMCKTKVPSVGVSNNSLLRAANEVHDSSCQREVCKTDIPGVGSSLNSLLCAANEVSNSGCHQKTGGETSVPSVDSSLNSLLCAANEVSNSGSYSSHLSRVQQVAAAGVIQSEELASPVPPTPNSSPPPPPTSAAELAVMDLPALPEKRKLPPYPEGNITQEEGEEYCKLICETYPEVFDGQKGLFRGAEATMFIKDGHLDQIKRTGIRPAAKIPYGLEEQYEKALDELYEDCVPVDGHELIAASQVVPVCQIKEGEEVVVYDNKKKLSSKGKIGEV